MATESTKCKHCGVLTSSEPGLFYHFGNNECVLCVADWERSEDGSVFFGETSARWHAVSVARDLLGKWSKVFDTKQGLSGFCNSCKLPLSSWRQDNWPDFSSLEHRAFYQLRLDCGGDCLICMTEYGDIDCQPALLRWLRKCRESRG